MTLGKMVIAFPKEIKQIFHRVRITHFCVHVINTFIHKITTLNKYNFTMRLSCKKYVSLEVLRLA